MADEQGQDARGKQAGTSQRSVSTVTRVARVGFFALSAAFALCVVVQIFLAGLAVFASPVYWARHTGFVHTFELLPLAMVLLALVGRLPRRLAWQSFGLYVLIFFMYFTANIRALAPVVAAFHPVLAMTLFWAAVRVGVQAWTEV